MSGHSQASASGRLRAARGCLLSTLLGHTPEVTDGPLRRETGRQSRLSNGRVRPTADVYIVRMKLQRDLFTVADQCIVQLVLERAKADLDRGRGESTRYNSGRISYNTRQLSCLRRELPYSTAYPLLLRGCDGM